MLDFYVSKFLIAVSITGEHGTKFQGKGVFKISLILRGGLYKEGVFKW